MSDQLPDDIRAMIDADRRLDSHEGIPEEARKRILRNVGAAVLAGGAAGVALGATAKAAASTGALAFLGDLLSRKISVAVTAFVVGGAAGAGGYVVATQVVHVKDPAPICPSAIPPAPSATPAKTYVAPKPSAVQPAPSVEPSASAPPPPSAPSIAPSIAPSASASVTDVALKNEAQLVSKADAALARGDHAGALAACDERAKSFPAGRMAEECEFTAIRALVGLGRASEARTRAESFRKRFPSSLYGAALNSMMGDASAP